MDFISLTDMLKAKDGEFAIIKNQVCWKRAGGMK